MGKDAALPRLHRVHFSPEVFLYPHIHYYFNGMTVWVDGLGRVVLSERNFGIPEMRYYVCLGRGGMEVGWVRVPVHATLMHSGGEGRPNGLGPVRESSF